MKLVNIHSAKTHLSALVEEAVGGEEILIAKAGKPMVRLVPVAGQQPRIPGALKGRIRIGDDFDAPLPADVAASFGIEP
jgi:prevent-host-death family protein